VAASTVSSAAETTNPQVDRWGRAGLPGRGYGLGGACPGRGTRPKTLNRSDLPSRANEDSDDQDEDDESEDHQAQVRGLESGAGPSDRRRRAGVDRCSTAVTHTARIRYRCGRDVRIVGPVNAQKSSSASFLLFTSPWFKASERMGDLDLSEQRNHHPW
jgi:hypothetical protein